MSIRNRVVSREDTDHLEPNLIDDTGDEAFMPGRFSQSRSQTQPRIPQSPVLQRTTSSQRRQAEAVPDDVFTRTSAPQTNIMPDSTTFGQPNERSDTRRTSLHNDRHPPPYRRSDVSPESISRITSATAGTMGPRIVAAIDYGTTFTGFALAKTQADHANLNEIEVLQNWGSSGDDNNQKVRTMISYLKSPDGEFQWGSNVSDHATAVVNTKLELEPQPTRLEELELTLSLLRGTGNLAFEHLKKIGPNPAYPSARPEQIVKDYLTLICKSACKPDSFRDIDMTKLAETRTPLDVVVTVPAKWSLEATDAIFKAVRGAGFNRTMFPTLHDTILISEPEAAAFFAIRDHQNTQNVDLLVDDCFILCDAGGGTVDAVSYQVKQIQPHLKLERATEPNSDQCGSAFIDTAFKNWLREYIGVENYAKLDRFNAHLEAGSRISAHAFEEGPIRRLVETFVIKKHAFSSSTQSVRIDLPEPLHALDVPGRVQQGELLISRDQMAELFSVCVNGVIELIYEQMELLKKAKHRRARNIILVGGFGASQYLQEQLLAALELERSTLMRPNPEKSLTAVVQGAVIYGIEKSRHSGVQHMSAITKSYAILLNGEFKWLIRKGDLILSTEQRRVFSKYFTIPLSACRGSRTYEMAVYTYRNRTEDDDDVPEFWDDGQYDVDKAGVVKCDFPTMLERDVRLHSDSERQRDIVLGPFRCCLKLSSVSLEVELLRGKTVLGRCTISVKTDRPRTNAPDNDWS